MARICYTSVIIQYYEDQKRIGKSLDLSVILLPEETNLLDAAIAYVLLGEEHGFLDLMFETQSRLTREDFCRRLLTTCYYFL